MKFISRDINWNKITYNVLGIKFSISRPQPYKMNIVRRAKELKVVVQHKVGYDLNLANPITFNEKINWLKLYYRDPKMPRIVDKYEFKNYIKEQLGEGYTVPLIGAWDNVDDIDFNTLPDKFVLKCNAQSDSKFIKIVRDKNTLNIDALKQEMRDWLVPEKTLKSSFCWAYNDVHLRIIAEEYIEQIDGQVYDYKFMCFNGRPRWVLACSDRGRNTVYENHDMNWNLIIPSPSSAAIATIDRPKHFDRMVEIAKQLSAPFPFVRVDFYEIEDSILLGEMTFYPNGGYNTYTPYYDKKFGSYIKLPQVDAQYPFLEIVRKKNKRTINIRGKEFFSFHKVFSNKYMTAQMVNAYDEIRSLSHSLKMVKAELAQTRKELAKLKTSLVTTVPDQEKTTEEENQ